MNRKGPSIIVLGLCVYLVMVIFFTSSSFGQKGQIPDREAVLTAMRKSADYMMNEVSCNGGFLHEYAEDFSEQWGEVPARKSQIWVQRTTPQMGELFLELFQTTDDEVYLQYAKKTANALIMGPSLGWMALLDRFR